MKFPIKTENTEGYFAIALVAGIGITMAIVIGIYMFYNIFNLNEKE